MTYYKAKSCDIVGDVVIGDNSSIWFQAVIRADRNSVHIGSGTNIQDGVIIHAGDRSSVEIGNNVTVGHGVILHGCTIMDSATIGMGSIIMDGAVIPENSIVAAGSLVTKGKTFPSGSLIMGSPAKFIRTLTEDEITEMHNNTIRYIEDAKKELEK